MRYLIDAIILFVIGAILIALLFNLSTISPHVEGRVVDASANIPIENINVCWERISKSSTIDKGCTITDINGNFRIPAMYKFFSKPVYQFKIYFNKNAINLKGLEPFSFEETPENEKYSVETFAVSFPKGIPTLFPLLVDMGLIQNK
jgi:hypothetical protein